jgi:hypothetical protein
MTSYDELEWPDRPPARRKERTDYQAQTTTECLSTWCDGTAGHDGPHFPTTEHEHLAERLKRIRGESEGN